MLLLSIRQVRPESLLIRLGGLELLLGGGHFEELE